MKIDIGLKDNSRKTVADALAPMLADSYALALKTQNFHWNVVGPEFPYLHKQFDELYSELAEAVDSLAERIRVLGHAAPGSFAAFEKLKQIKESTGAPPAAKEMVGELWHDNEALVRHARKVKDLAESVGDVETGDMMIERMQVHAKAAWMLRAQLE
jgi:starvation-inducible DNA-binding protein